MVFIPKKGDIKNVQAHINLEIYEQVEATNKYINDNRSPDQDQD
ncbi:MAG: hypothetical protein ACXAC7_11845 [Candidatus Hodarchaeales archaeon]